MQYSNSVIFWIILATLTLNLRRKDSQNPIIKIFEKLKWVIILIYLGFVITLQVRHPFSMLHIIISAIVLIMIFQIIWTSKQGKK